MLSHNHKFFCHAEVELLFSLICTSLPIYVCLLFHEFVHIFFVINMLFVFFIICFLFSFFFLAYLPIACLDEHINTWLATIHCLLFGRGKKTHFWGIIALSNLGIITKKKTIKLSTNLLLLTAVVFQAVSLPLQKPGSNFSLAHSLLVFHIQ